MCSVEPSVSSFASYGAPVGGSLTLGNSRFDRVFDVTLHKTTTDSGPHYLHIGLQNVYAFPTFNGIPAAYLVGCSYF